jgi:hypothetical protein
MPLPCSESWCCIYHCCKPWTASHDLPQERQIWHPEKNIESHSLDKCLKEIQYFYRHTIVNSVSWQGDDLRQIWWALQQAEEMDWYISLAVVYNKHLLSQAFMKNGHTKLRRNNRIQWHAWKTSTQSWQKNERMKLPKCVAVGPELKQCRDVFSRQHTVAASVHPWMNQSNMLHYY